MRSTVYLSGPITGLEYGACTDWREYARQQLDTYNIEGLSPMRGKEFLDGLGVIDGEMQAVMENAMTQGRAIVGRDRWDTTRCDFMLVNLLGAKRVSIGTVVELGWADAARRPVVLVMEPKGNVHEHEFVRQLAAYHVDSLDAGIDLIVSALAPRYLVESKQIARRLLGTNTI